MSNLQFVGKIKSDEDQRFDFIKKFLDWHIGQRCKQEIDLMIIKYHYLRSLDPWSKEPQLTFDRWLTVRIDQMMQQQVTDLLPYIDQGFKDAGFYRAFLIIDHGVSVKSSSNEIIRHEISWQCC